METFSIIALSVLTFAAAAVGSVRRKGGGKAVPSTKPAKATEANINVGTDGTIPIYH